MTADLLRQEIDLNALVDALGERAPQLRSAIGTRVSAAINARTTSELLTLTVTEGGHTRTVSPSPTPDYAKSLFHYVKGTGGATISCRIEDVVEAAVVAAKMSGQVAEKLVGQSADLNRQVAASFVAAALDEVLGKLHDDLLPANLPPAHARMKRRPCPLMRGATGVRARICDRVT